MTISDSPVIFWVVKFLHFVRIFCKKEYSVMNSLFFWKKKKKKVSKIFLKKLSQLAKLPTTWKGAEYFSIFLFFLEYCQIWLNTLMSDGHLSNTLVSQRWGTSDGEHWEQQAVTRTCYLLMERSLTLLGARCIFDGPRIHFELSRSQVLQGGGFLHLVLKSRGSYTYTL